MKKSLTWKLKGLIGKMADDTRLTYWLLGFIGTVCLAIGGFWMTSMYSQLRNFEAGAVERTNKITTLEANQNFTTLRLARIEDNQIKANEKLDDILVMVTKHMASTGSK
jgi:hypothetical protein